MSEPQSPGPGKKVWRPSPPYWACLAMLAAAIVANAAAANTLWLAYSLVGVVVLAAVFAMDVHFAWRLPRRLLWWCGVPFAMHYVGGSLSGLHQWGENGLYYALPWWDNLVHFLGTGAVGVAAAFLLAPRMPRQPTAILLAAGSIAATVGFLVELYEFAGFLWFGTVDQGYYTNTVLDLYYNALGGFAGAWLWLRPMRSSALTQPAPDAR